MAVKYVCRCTYTWRYVGSVLHTLCTINVLFIKDPWHFEHCWQNWADRDKVVILWQLWMMDVMSEETFQPALQRWPQRRKCHPRSQKKKQESYGSAIDSKSGTRLYVNQLCHFTRVWQTQTDRHTCSWLCSFVIEASVISQGQQNNGAQSPLKHEHN